MFKKILIGLVVIIGGLCAFIATRPSAMHIERTVTVAAPAEVAFAQVNDFHNWKAWSPWEKLDPTMKTTFSGAPTGPGAHYAWVGNKEVGEGAMTITSAQPNEKVVIKLEFIKPWTATNIVTFGFKGTGDSTAVTWAMDGEQNFMMKAMGVFMNMDKMIGDDFDKGLADLKKAAEADAKKRAEDAAKAAAPPPPAADAPGAPAAPAPPAAPAAAKK